MKLSRTIIRIFFLVITTLFILNTTVNVYASSNLKFEHIQTLDGLSHDTVYSIAQDKNGLLWFGTEDGLNRFDGYEIDIYRGEKGGNTIGNANISTLVVDDANRIWIASWGGGLQVLDQALGTVKIYKHDETNANSLSDDNVHSIFIDSRNNVWVGTYTQGLNLYNPDLDNFTSYKHDENNTNSLSHNRVWWISEDESGNILLGTNKGLDSFNPETNQFSHFDMIDVRVRTIYWDREKTLWLGTQSGLCQLDIDDQTTECFTNELTGSAGNVIASIFEDSFGTFWVGTSNGLNIFDRERKEFIQYLHDETEASSLSNNDVRVIFEDASSNLWIGTRGGGINKLDIKPSKFKTYNTHASDLITLSDGYVYSLLYDEQEILWVGTNNGGLNRFDLNGKSEVFMNDVSLETNRNLQALEDDGDYLWVGSLGGLNRFDKNTHEVMTYIHNDEDQTTISHNTILSLLKDSKGNLWVGTLNGLNLFDDETQTFTSFVHDAKNDRSISSNSIQTIFEDSKNRLWIGTNNGLNLMDQVSGEFKKFVYNYMDTDSISDNIVFEIFEDSSQNLWIGTQFGLNKYDEESEGFIVFTDEDGLPSNTIKSIQEDENGNLWIGTNTGISNYDIANNSFINFDAYDGLQGNGYSIGASEVLPNNILLFGGTNGLDYIDIDSAYKNQYEPKLYIRNFLINGEKFDITSIESEELKLNYTQRTMHVEMASLDYTNSSRNQFAYMLEGFDKEWIYLGNRNTIDYSNLPIGAFTLRIKSTNSDRVWNENSLALSMIVSPPWWKSNIAYAVYAIALVVFIYGLIRFYLYRQIKKNDQLQAMLNSSISVMSKIGEMRDIYTVGHQKRVQQLSIAIAKEMNLSKEQITKIEIGSIIHDIGKINIPTEYLNKPGKLSPIEFKIIQTHVENGCKIIKDIDFPIEVLNVVAQHHERIDGTGYPNGLKDHEISLESKIVSVADVVEAMCNDRPYRPAVGIDAALNEIEKNKGTKYDPLIVKICLKLFNEDSFKFS